MIAALRALRALALRDRVFYAHVGVTHRCNMRCRMCTVPDRGDANREVTPERFRVVARELRKLGCAAVSLGGGEPLLHADLPGIVEAFAREGMRVRVLTNGIAGAKNIVGDLARAGAKDMSVSIDSLDPVAQEKLEDLPGLLPRKLETIEAILKHLPRGLHIVNAVVTPITLPGLVPLARFARRIGFYASFIPIHLADADSEHHFFSDEPSFRFNPTHRAALRATYAELVRLRDAGWVFNSRAYLENSLRYLLGEPIDWSCLAGRLYVSVDPTASISICHQFEDAESVPADGFAERYLHGDWRAKAESVATPCHACYRPCWAEIDHLALDGEAFFGALRFQARSLWRPARALTREQLAEAARDLAGPAPVAPVPIAAGVAV